jgi:hypothetical protein
LARRRRLGALRPRASSRPGPRWWRRHWIATSVSVGIAIFLTGAVVELFRIRSEVEAGRVALTNLSIDRLDGGLVATIDDAAAHLDRADSIADRSPFLAPLSLLPVVGPQIDGVRRLTDAVAILGDTARAAARAVDVDLQRAGGEPAARIELLDTAAAELDRVEAEAARIDLGKARDLVAPLRNARTRLQAELDGLPDRFADARVRLRALSRLLEGPTRYLVLAANNAEMRGGAGMPLSGGVVTFEHGDLTFGDFESIANRWAGRIAPTLVPPEYATTYRQFRMGQSWLQTAVSPNFETVGPIFDAMSSSFASFGPVDGVLVVDVVMLRELLSVIGPVDVDGTTYTADNIEQEVLNENYLRFDTGAAAGERREAQGEIASAIFDAMKGRDIEIADLAIAVQSSAAGRHLLAYADDPEVQDLWDDVGAAGALDPGALMVTVQNIAADKLDWYIDPTVTMRAVPQTGTGAWKVRVSVRVPNPERTVTSAAVESFIDGYDDGIHRALVAIYLPTAAYDIRSLDLPYSESGLDPPLTMVGKRIFIEEGDAKTVAIEFTLPPEHAGVYLLPSGRVRPVRYVVNGIVLDDAIAHTLYFGGSFETTRQDAGAPALAAGLAALGAAALLAGTRRLVWTDARPLVAPSPLAQRLPSLGLLLFLAAAGVLVAGALIERWS